MTTITHDKLTPQSTAGYGMVSCEPGQSEFFWPRDAPLLSENVDLMTRLTRQIFIERTCQLLNQGGRTDFALTDVLDSCGAQKGSLYHFFPKGKHELVLAAVHQMTECAVAHVQSCLESERRVADAAYRQLSDLARWVEKPGPRRAIPFSAIAAITGDENEEVTAACQDALKALDALYCKHLKSEELKPAAAKRLSGFIVTSTEGAFLVARTQQTGQPLRNAASSLQDYIASQVGTA